MVIRTITTSFSIKQAQVVRGVHGPAETPCESLGDPRQLEAIFFTPKYTSSPLRCPVTVLAPNFFFASRNQILGPPVLKPGTPSSPTPSGWVEWNLGPEPGISPNLDINWPEITRILLGKYSSIYMKSLLSLTEVPPSIEVNPIHKSFVTKITYEGPLLNKDKLYY